MLGVLGVFLGYGLLPPGLLAPSFNRLILLLTIPALPRLLPRPLTLPLSCSYTSFLLLLHHNDPRLKSTTYDTCLPSNDAPLPSLE